MASAALQPSRLLRGSGSALYEVAVGLELHCQLSAAATKLFSASLAARGAAPNAQAAAFDAAHPGTLPTAPNGACVLDAVRAGLALRGRVARACGFERKHYFYPDLPHGFQITQLARPIVTGGRLLFSAPLAAQADAVAGADARRLARLALPRVVGIDRIQLEMDSGKSSHDLDADAAESGASRVDLNRAGVALIEVVTQPDLRSALEAVAFLRSALSLLQHIGVCDGAMEEGALRCDVNVSIARVAEPAAAFEAALFAAEVTPFLGPLGTAPPPPLQHEEVILTRSLLDLDLAPGESSGVGPALLTALAFRRARMPLFGARVEMKNLSSVRAVARAVDHEARRQVALVEGGGVNGAGAVERETRAFDALARSSRRLRAKDELADYRFLPEPDLAPLLLDEAYVAAARASLPELPEAAAARLVGALGLPAADAATLVAAPGALAFFERALRRARDDVAVSAAEGDGEHADAGAKDRQLAHAVANWVVNELSGLLRGARSSPAAEAAAPRAPSTPLVLSPPAAAERWGWGDADEGGDGEGNNEVVRVGDGEAARPLSKALSSSPPPPLALAPPLSLFALEHRGGLSPESLGELVALVEVGLVSGRRAKQVLGLMVEAAYASASAPAPAPAPAPALLSPRALVAARGWLQLNDRGALLALARAAVADPALRASVDKWRGQGQERVLGALVAHVLAASGGSANPELAAACLREALGPLGARPGGHIGRKERARLQAEAAEAAKR